MRICNLAFSFEDPDIQSLKEFEVIDFTATQVKAIELIDFPNLKRFRACQCGQLTKCTIKGCPKLEVIDFSNSKNLAKLEIQNLPSLLTIDISMTKLSNESLDFDLPQLQTLIASFTSLSCLKPNHFPNLINLDISDTAFSNLSFLLDLKKLQRFRFMSFSHFSADTVEFNFNLLFTHPSLTSFFAGPGRVICDSLPNQNESSSTLQFIILEDVEFERGDPLNIQSRVKYFCDKYTYEIPPITSADIASQEWPVSMSLLYGPWGIPKCDNHNHESIPKAEIDILSHLKKQMPENCTISFNELTCIDHMMGAIFGSALGSLLGLSTESSRKSLASITLQTPLGVIWSHLNDDPNTVQFLKGTVTTEIEQLVLLMRAITSSGNNQKEILQQYAHLLHQWSCEGISEHKQERCLQENVSLQNTMRHPYFLDDPVQAAYLTCNEFSNDGSATSRTIPVSGIYKFWDEDIVKNNAKDFCCVTQYESCSIFSTVLLSLIISKIIQKASIKSESENIDINIDECIQQALSFCGDDILEYQDDIQCLMTAESFDELVLAEGTQSFVLKSTAAAVLALRSKLNFEEAISAIIRSGGDTDTNASIVGAVIGAYVGFQNIPHNLLKYLFNGNWIFNDFAKLLLKMGLKPPESPFIKLSCL